MSNHLHVDKVRAEETAKQTSNRKMSTHQATE